MALADTTFITVADVKTHLDISVSTWDTVIENLINMCTQYAMNYCGGRRFIAPASDETEYYDGDDKGMIFLDSWPVQSITSVSYASGDYDNQTWTAYNAASDYRRDMKRGILHFGGLDRGVQNIRVIYTAGYADSDAVPWDLKLGIIEAVSKEFDRRKSQGVSAESVGGASVTWSMKWDPNLTTILDNYRRFF